MITIPFHQYQRYKMVQLIIENLRENKKIKILEVGANEHKNLEKFLKNDDIYYLDIELSEEKLKDEQYIKGDATDLKFEDNEFDYIVALDVLEHIPKEKRELFFENINRVSKYGFVVSFPFDNDETAFVEERIEYFYKYMYNQKINWHEEHKKMGLPFLKDINNILKDKLKIKTKTLYHGDNYLFEKLMNMEALNNTDNTLNDYWQTINKYYNTNVFYEDRVEEERNAIRTFIIYHKNFEKLNTFSMNIEKIINFQGESKKKILSILDDFRMNVTLAQISNKNKMDKEKLQQIEQFNILKNEYDKLIYHMNMMEKEYNTINEYVKDLEKQITIFNTENSNLEKENGRLKQENGRLKQENSILNSNILNLKLFKEETMNSRIWKLRNRFKKP